jgi:hypothetical protein
MLKRVVVALCVVLLAEVALRRDLRVVEPYATIIGILNWRRHFQGHQ